MDDPLHYPAHPAAPQETAAPLRLAFAVSLYFDYGGMQRSLARIAQECVSRGHPVDLYTGGIEGGAPAGVTVKLLDTRALTNTASNRRLAEGLHAAVARGAYDAVVGFNKLPGLDVYYAAGPCLAAELALRPRLLRWLPRYRALLAEEANVFARGRDTEILLFAPNAEAQFIHHYDTEPARFHRLPPGINRERLLAQAAALPPRASLRAALGIATHEIALLLVASRFRTKGLDRALRALAALPQDVCARLLVAGEDDRAPYLRIARRLGVADRLHFLGACDDMARLYRAADLLIHPARSENTGTVLLEALLLGLPVLTTANCGFAMHIERANAGRVCPEPFVQSHFDALLREALASPERSAWSPNGVRYCQREDLYSLIPRAADAILARAARNRAARA